MITIIILVAVYYFLKEAVKDWYAYQIIIIKTVSPYELGLYIALGAILVIAIVCGIISDCSLYVPSFVEAIPKICFWLFGAGAVTGVVLGFIYEGWHWIFTLILIIYGYIFSYRVKNDTLFD